MKIKLTAILITIWYLIVIFVLPKLGHPTPAILIHTKSIYKQFLESHDSNKKVTTIEIEKLNEKSYIAGKGYIVKKVSKESLLATPIIREYYSENIVKRLIFLDFHKQINPNFRINLKTKTITEEYEKETI